jgi:Fe-S cluster assembly protein SufB
MAKMNLFLISEKMDSNIQNDIRAFGDISRETLDTSDVVDYLQIAKKGIDEEVVRQIWTANKEPQWMLAHRLKSLGAFQKFEKPTW